MSGLQTFRSQLGRLKLRRSFARWQTAVARGVVLDVIALFALLLLDFSLRLETTPRLFVIVAIGGVLVWRKYRHILPDLLHDETVVDIALLLERTHGVDNDLVAALQFDAATSGNVGSLTLQKAVIARAAGISETLEFRSQSPARTHGERPGAALVPFCRWRSFGSRFPATRMRFGIACGWAMRLIRLGQTSKMSQSTGDRMWRAWWKVKPSRWL